MYLLLWIIIAKNQNGCKFFILINVLGFKIMRIGRIDQQNNEK